MWPERSSWKEVGRKRVYSISSLPGGGKHRETQALPLSGMASIKAGYFGILRKVGAKGENVEEIIEVTKSRAPFQ